SWRSASRNVSSIRLRSTATVRTWPARSSSPSASRGRQCSSSPRRCTTWSWRGNASTFACASSGRRSGDERGEVRRRRVPRHLRGRPRVRGDHVAEAAATGTRARRACRARAREEEDGGGASGSGGWLSPMAELLFWPALLAYGEAAFAYLNDARHPGISGRLATWGVRIGWLVQTALLAVQAARADGFPWSTWAGSLNLFVWLVVGAYLIWGCQPRYRLLGLAVLPLAVVLFALAHAGGGTSVHGASRYSNLFLVLHVGLVLVAFAGFTVAAGLSALYLWQERRLKRRETSILRVRAPALARLDELSARTIAVALPALPLGIAGGIARLRD